jgi:hypothetical protein
MTTQKREGILGILLLIVIGLGLVATVATSTTSASTALAPFAGAQSLVILVPLIFVAIILIKAYHGTSAKGHGGLYFEGKTSLVRAVEKIAELQVR